MCSYTQNWGLSEMKQALSLLGSWNPARRLLPNPVRRWKCPF